MSEHIDERAAEARARRAAKRVGLLARKSRRMLSLDNEGGFMLIEPSRNLCILGRRFDVSANEVISYCSAFER